MATTANAPERVYTFTYRARNSAGDLVKGRAQAPERRVVIRRLLKDGLLPVKIAGGPGTGLQKEIGPKKGVKHKSLVVATRQLAVMFGAHLEPLQVLDIVIEDLEDLALKEALTDIRLRMANGAQMSDAMLEQGIFPPQVIYAVASGEVSGDLKGALSRIADQYEKEDKLRSKIRKALMYPGVLSLFTVAVFVLMVVYLVPKMTESLIDVGGPGAQLPLVTRFTLALGDVVTIVTPLLLLLFVPTWIWYRKHRFEDEVRMRMDPVKMRIPVIGRLLHKIALSRFCRTLSGLLSNGVERLEALQITALSVGNYQMEQAVLKTRDNQRNGAGMAATLRGEPLFPPRVLSMIEAGESVGKVDELLAYTATMYDGEVDEMAENMTTLIAPFFIVVIAGLIGLIAMAIYMPYMSLLTMI